MPRLHQVRLLGTTTPGIAESETAAIHQLTRRRRKRMPERIRSLIRDPYYRSSDGWSTKP
jgi:hypothetical protein